MKTGHQNPTKQHTRTCSRKGSEEMKEKGRGTSTRQLCTNPKTRRARHTMTGVTRQQTQLEQGGEVCSITTARARKRLDGAASTAQTHSLCFHWREAADLVSSHQHTKQENFSPHQRHIRSSIIIISNKVTTYRRE